MKEVSLIAKLKLNESRPLLCTGLPEDIRDALAGFALTGRPEEGVLYTQALFFCLSSSDVAALPPAFAHLQEDAVVWAAYPKKGALRTDINRDKGWEPFGEAGYVPVSQISVNESWSALWFKKKEKVKTLLRAVPMEQRVTEGIDYVARTATLPADAEAALRLADPELVDFFNSMPFSHKKEHLVAIAEAKKPETRQRRIQRMTELVAAYREEKQKKKK